MRINSFEPSQNVTDTRQVNRRQDKKAEVSQAQTPAQDTAQISERARIQQAVAKAPEVRQDRVAEIKAQIDAGTYNVSNSQLADAMMKDFSKTK